MICTSNTSRNSSNRKWWDNDCNGEKRKNNYFTHTQTNVYNILGDRGQYVWKRYFGFIFTFLTK